MKLEAGSEPFPGIKLLQLRGRGGFADVWEASTAKGEKLALKFMQSKNSFNSSREVRLIQAIQKLSHPNILRLDRVWTIPGYIVVAMELADGSLLDLLEVYLNDYRLPLSAELALHYLQQIACALDYLNAKKHVYDGRTVGFQHCDVKPSNLLLVGETVKLADFGTCTVSSALTNTCERCGTLEFAAPEVHRGFLNDKCDQYSLAVTYYHMRTGGFPFPPPPPNFSRSYSYRRPNADLSLITPPERPAIAQALDIEPNNRWPSCVAFARALVDATKPRENDQSSKFSSKMVPVSRSSST